MKGVETLPMLEVVTLNLEIADALKAIFVPSTPMDGFWIAFVFQDRPALLFPLKSASQVYCGS